VDFVQVPDYPCSMDIFYPSMVETEYSVYRLRSALEAKATQLQIEPAPRQTERARSLRDIATSSIERRLDHVALDLLHGGGEVGRDGGAPA
jgi:hypothetical protein